MYPAVSMARVPRCRDPGIEYPNSKCARCTCPMISMQVRTTAWYYKPYTTLLHQNTSQSTSTNILRYFYCSGTKTHPWVYYLGRRLADPTTRRQLTGHTLRRNRRRGLQNRTQETGSQGACHHHSLYIKILATRVSTKFVLARLWVYSKILWYMHG